MTNNKQVSFDKLESAFLLSGILAELLEHNDTVVIKEIAGKENIVSMLARVRSHMIVEGMTIEEQDAKVVHICKKLLSNLA